MDTVKMYFFYSKLHYIIRIIIFYKHLHFKLINFSGNALSPLKSVKTDLFS